MWVCLFHFFCVIMFFYVLSKWCCAFLPEILVLFKSFLEKFESCLGLFVC